MGGSMVMVDSKAESFQTEAETAGWKTKVERDGTRVTVTATRAKEVVSVTWEGNACLNESIYLLDGRSRKLRNAAAARRILNQDGAERAPANKPKRKSSVVTPVIPQPRVTEDEEPEPQRRPTWGSRHISVPDREILRKVLGKEIIWINSRTKVEDRATVLANPDQRQLRVEYTGSKRRVITFAAKGEGFRSVYVDAIVTVR